LPSKKGIYAKLIKRKALNKKESTEMKILIILPKITPKIIETKICIITLKSNFTLLLQFLHVLVSQKGETNINNSHNLRTCLSQ
jgi:hypothetical protein